MSNEDDKLIGADLVLLLLRAEGAGPNDRDRVNGITRLEKLLFLADQETKVQLDVSEAFKFKAYNYGPYSKGVYDAVELLEEAQLVREEQAFDGRALDAMEQSYVAAEGVDGVERRFYLTEEGRAVSDLLAKRNPEVFDDLTRIKREYGSVSLRQLIQYVYRRYPAYAEASLIRDQVL